MRLYLISKIKMQQKLQNTKNLVSDVFDKSMINMINEQSYVIRNS